ncbi:MAG: MFS transporter [Saprospiraceae bacterium]|nr:MFS transporter [Saprospiraceae bacterium]
MTTKRVINRSVWILSWVSLCTDFASEMLYPIMPIYLQQIGFSVALIGLLEGLAEAIAGLSKGYFGRLSDDWKIRVPFVRWGYGLSAISKPMMAIFTFPLWIFAARTMDRIGKGLRTGARDALLSSYTMPEHKGRVFGFHRSMDTIGAFLGPLFALLFLQFFTGAYQTLFLLAFIPGLAAVGITFLLKEPKVDIKIKYVMSSFSAFLKYPFQSALEYRRLLIGLLAFALFNSSDVFLLLMLKFNGFSDSQMLMAYIFYNAIYALSAYPLGIIGDRIGLKKMFILGLFVFTIVYTGMALNHNSLIFWFLMGFYGLYAAATEGIAKAWISNLIPTSETATAIGTYEAFKSLITIGASVLAGIIWEWVNPTATFALTAFGTALLMLYFSLFTNSQHAARLSNE